MDKMIHVNPKYTLGDEIYYYEDHAIKKGEIYGIIVDISRGFLVKVGNELIDNDINALKVRYSYTLGNAKTKKEEHLFDTPEEAAEAVKQDLLEDKRLYFKN